MIGHSIQETLTNPVAQIAENFQRSDKGIVLQEDREGESPSQLQYL